MIDQPGKLHLGDVYDSAAGERTAEPFLLSIRDLTAGAVCLGGTGAGKTDLCARVIEEGLLQGIPALVLDTRGDLCGRPFGESGADGTGDREGTPLRADDADDARKRKLEDRAVWRVYTPGSASGLAVNALQSLHPPTAVTSGNLTWARHTAVLREHAALVVTALLALAGVEPGTGQGLGQGQGHERRERREHVLLTTIFESAWRAGLPLDLELLIRMVQNPPVQRVGAFDLTMFYPKTERAALTLALDRLAASPALDAWRQGEPLDVAAWLQPLRNGGTNPAGRTRASLFNLAPLADAERQFFATLFLAHLLLWARAHAGTSVLRCVLCVDAADDLHGLPGTSQGGVTPAGAALTAALRQGRSAGVGVLLTSRDPSRLDSGLLNDAETGMFLVGRYADAPARAHVLRVLEGLEGAGVRAEPDELEPLISRLPPRAFLALDAANTQRTFVL